MTRARSWWLAAALLGGLLAAAPLLAEVSSADQSKLDSVKQSLDQAVDLFKKKKFEEMGQLIQEVETKVGELKTSTAKGELAPIETKLAAAQRLLKNALDNPEPLKKPAVPAKAAPVNPKTKAAPAGQVSFVKDVAPILVGRCQGCHINRASGGFSVATYDSLMRGSTAGRVFTPGKSDGATLVDVLASGSMPQGGQRLSDDDINKIAKWIDQGGNFDGPDRTAALVSYVAGARAGGNMAGLQVVQATGKEKISFMRDIAPVIVGECVRCHVAQQGAGNLSLTSFGALLRGAQGRPIIAPGNPEGSMIISKLRGTAKEGRRMPAGRDPLPEETIKKFETWISEGAKYDGETSFNTFAYLLDVIKARKMTHDELAAWRLDIAKKNWAKANPSNSPEIVSADDHIIVGRLSTAKLQEASKIAEAVRFKVAANLKAQPSKPMIKGKLSVFLFDRRFEVTELLRMVEGRDPPTDILAMYQYDVIDCYTSMMGPKDNDTQFAGLMAEQFASAYVQSLSKGVPRWYAVGMGRVVAGRVEPKSTVIKIWEDAVPAAIAATSRYDQFVDADTLDGAGSSLAYALVKYMSSGPNAGRNNMLLDLLRKGTPFDTALQQAFGADAKKIAAACFR